MLRLVASPVPGRALAVLHEAEEPVRSRHGGNATREAARGVPDAIRAPSADPEPRECRLRTSKRNFAEREALAYPGRCLLRGVNTRQPSGPNIQCITPIRRALLHPDATRTLTAYQPAMVQAWLAVMCGWASPPGYCGGSTSMSNSLSCGSAMHRRWKPSRSCVVLGSNHVPPSALNLGRNCVEMLDDEVAVHPVLGGLRLRDALEANCAAAGCRREQHELAVADGGFHLDVQQGAPEWGDPGRDRRCRWR
jgi:hypothetical protein